MNKKNWKRIGRTLAAALLAGSLALGTVSAVALAVRPQPVVAAETTTHYPQSAFNYGDKRASIYVDPSTLTSDQLATVNQGIANVQTMLNGIFTITVAPTRSSADIVIAGKDLSGTPIDGQYPGGLTYVNYNRVVKNIAQHPNGTQIFVDNSYRSYATSKYFTAQWSPQLPAQTDPNYQYYFNAYQTYFDHANKSQLLVVTEHEIGHGIGLGHQPVNTYGLTIMDPNAGDDNQGNPAMDVTKDPTYIRAAQAIYGGQAIALGETDVKQPTQGYHSSNAGNSGSNSSNSNSGNTDNTGNSGNSGNSGNTGNSGNGTPTQKNTVESANGTVVVNQLTDAEVYSDVNFTKDTGKKLPRGSKWKGFAIVSDTAGNPVGFNVGGQQYVKFSQAAFIYATGTEHKSEPVSGVFKIVVPGHPTWGTAFYADYLQVKGVLRGGSKWRVYARKTLNDGKQYYNLGGNQWIRADYGSFN